MSDTVDLVGRLAYLDAEVEVDSFGSVDEALARRRGYKPVK